MKQYLKTELSTAGVVNLCTTNAAFELFKYCADGPSLAVCENRWEMVRLGIVRLGNGWEIISTKIHVIWCISDSNSE